jgi:two-component sensor histidine kinase
VVDLEPVVFGVDLAVPCGLIINELVANALKHAFPGERVGELRVGMSAGPDQYVLSVRDNGVGLPPETDYLHTETLGLQLVNMLTEQIGGHLTLERTTGTEFVVRFPRQPESR